MAQPGELRRSATALLVIDMQNAFCEEAGSINGIGLPSARLAPAVEPCAALAAAARQAGVPVIYTRYVYRADHSDAGLMGNEIFPQLVSAKTLRDGTWDAEIVAALAPGEGDAVIDKNRPSAFFGTRLETLLKGLGVSDLVVCGVTTNCCVESTVRDASHRDYRCFVVADAVREYDDERHDASLKAVAMLFGYVVASDEVLAAWRG